MNKRIRVPKSWSHLFALRHGKQVAPPPQLDSEAQGGRRVGMCLGLKAAGQRPGAPPASRSWSPSSSRPPPPPVASALDRPASEEQRVHPQPSEFREVLTVNLPASCVRNVPSPRAPSEQESPLGPTPGEEELDED